MIYYLHCVYASVLGSPFPADDVAEEALGVDSMEGLRVEPAD